MQVVESTQLEGNVLDSTTSR